MRVTGQLNRLRKRMGTKSYKTTMDIYEEVMDKLVQSDGRIKSFNDLSGNDFRLKVGDVVAVKSPDDERYYVTVFVKLNPLTQKLRYITSDAVYGVIPDGIREITPQQLQRQMNLPNTQSFNAFGNKPSFESMDEYQRWSNNTNQGDEK